MSFNLNGLVGKFDGFQITLHLCYGIKLQAVTGEIHRDIDRIPGIKQYIKHQSAITPLQADGTADVIKFESKSIQRHFIAAAALVHDGTHHAANVLFGRRARPVLI